MKESQREELLRSLGFTEGVDIVEIAPKKQHLYNLIINSSIMLPKESAELLHKGTYWRYHS